MRKSAAYPKSFEKYLRNKNMLLCLTSLWEHRALERMLYNAWRAGRKHEKSKNEVKQ